MKWSDSFVTLTDGRRVRYSFFTRDDSKFHYLRFVGPDGKNTKRCTNEAVKHRAVEEAHRIIKEAYEQRPEVAAADNTWAAARARLKEAMLADGKRPSTVTGYLESLDRLTATFPLAAGPADVTERMANDFKVRYGSGARASRRKGGGGPQKARAARSLDSRLRTLKAVFGWLVRLGLAGRNVFAGVARPALDRKEVKFVKADDVSHFFGWLAERYGQWRMPALFFSVKALSGCRLQDVCGLRSAQLRDGRIVFEADLTKNRSERYVILPEDVYAELDAYRGPTHLWERYPSELKEANRRLGTPTHRQNEEFSPRRLYLWVAQIMGKYQGETGRHLSSHDFRRAAFTRAAERGVHPARAAAAFDVTSETMLRYYTATEKKKVADEVLRDLAGDLLPRPKKEA